MESNKVYLYVNGFEWTDKLDTHEFEGHLKEGRVYQATTTPSEEFGTLYTIELFQNKKEPGLVLHKLSGSFPRWSCDIIKVEGDAVIDLDITDEDMDMMAREESHEVVGAPRNDKEAMGMMVQSVGESMLKIIKEDEDAFKIVTMIVKSIETGLTAENYLSLTDGLAMMEGQSGRVANMTLAASFLEGHLNAGSNSPENLLSAIFQIFLEFQRTLSIKLQ